VPALSMPALSMPALSMPALSMPAPSRGTAAPESRPAGGGAPPVF
jgi:hypothetical protein